MRAAVFIPCYIDQLLPRVGQAVVKVLQRVGVEVTIAKSQTCCGQPAFNAGYADQARDVARFFLDQFADAEVLIVPSGSCTTMVRVFYPQLFASTPEHDRAAHLAARTWEFSDFLVTHLGVRDVGANFPHPITFHDGCHGLRELGISDQPRELLRHVRGLTLTEMTERRTCCGFGGTFAVKFPEISNAMAQVKCASILATDTRYVVSNDSSCLMQIQGWANRHGQPIESLHLAEVLATQ
jgi:L-lactate dehydrogenase complex protein LldE